MDNSLTQTCDKRIICKFQVTAGIFYEAEAILDLDKQKRLFFLDKAIFWVSFFPLEYQMKWNIDPYLPSQPFHFPETPGFQCIQ